MDVLPCITAYQFGIDYVCSLQNVNQFKGSINITSHDPVSQTSQVDGICRRPGEDHVSEVRIDNQEHFFVLAKHLDRVIRINGTDVNIVEETKEKALPMLKEWSEIIVKEHEVMKEENEEFHSCKTKKDCTEEMKNKYDNLQGLNCNILALQDLFEQIESDSNRDQVLNAKSTLQRSQFLQQNVLDGGIREKVEKKANIVSNSLRSLGNNKRDRELCKRAERTNGDLQEMLKKITKLKGLLPKLEAAAENEGKDTKRCAFSRETSLESAILAIKELDNVASIDINNSLSLFGLLGIPIKHELYKGDEHQNYTDPNNLGVNQGLNDTITHIDPSISLNQASLWHLTKIRKPFNTLGFDEEITAVVPIKSWNHPLIWNAYNSMTSIAKLQASAQIRRTVTPLADDRCALGSATFLKMIHLWETPTIFQSTIMSEMLQSVIQKFKRCQPHIQKLTEENPDVQMTKTMPSSLGPFAKMFFNENLFKFAGSDKSRSFWRAAVSNTIHWRVNRALSETEKVETIKHLFGLLQNGNTETHEKVPNLEVAYNYVNGEKKLLEPSSLYLKVYDLTKSYEGKIHPEMFRKALPNEEEFGSWIAGYNFKLFSLIEVIKGLLCKGTKERLLDGKMKYQHLNSEEEAKDWIEKIVQQKQDEWNQEKLKQLEISKFLTEASTIPFEKFAENLQKNIPNEKEKILKVQNEHGEKILGISEVVSELTKDVCNVVDIQEKAELLLTGKCKDREWNGGTSLNNLENRAILQTKLEFLQGFVDAQKKSFENMSIKETKYFLKHTYRQKGSRAGYKNDRPSFWAVTSYSEPWAFYKNNMMGYHDFIERLEKYQHGDPIQKGFFDKWKHLLTFVPTRTRTSKPSNVNYVRRTYTFDVLAHSFDQSCGYNTFWNHLLLIDPKAENYHMNNVDMDVLCEKWKTLLQELLPERAEELIHSIQEIFGIEDISHKACTTFSILKNSFQTGEIKNDQIDTKLYPILDKVLKPASAYQKQNDSKGCLNAKMSIYAEDIDDVMVHKHTAILKKLIPSHAKSIIDALNTVYKQNDTKKAIAAEHVLRRYCQMQFTSAEAVQQVKDMLTSGSAEAVQQVKDMLTSGKSARDFDQAKNRPFGCILKPLYDVIIHEPLPENIAERDVLKEQIKNVLEDIKINKRLQDWIFKKCDQKSTKYGWEPMKDPIKSEDLENTSVDILDIFYGGNTRFATSVNFDLVHKENNRNLDDRLMKLNHVFRIALENIENIFPKITVKNNIIEIQNVKAGLTEENENYLMNTLRNIWGKATNNESYREELLEHLRKEFPLSTQKEVLDLFENEAYKDVDNLKIEIRTIDENKNSTILIKGLIMWPNMLCRLNELPEQQFVSFLNIFDEDIPRKLLSSILNGVIRNASLFTEGEDCFKLSQEVRKIVRKDDDLLFGFFDFFRKKGGTVGDILLALKACKDREKDDVNLSEEENTEKEKIVVKVLEHLDAFINKTYKDWENGFKIKLPDVILMRWKFEEFMKKHGLSQLRKMTSTQLLEKIHAREVLVGDQIWFWRSNTFADFYAHVAVFIGETNGREGEANSETAPQNYVVHVTPRKRVHLKKLLKLPVGKISCIPVQEALHAGDELFVVRYPETDGLTKEEMKNRALACLNPKITFHYNGYFGSCETFASLVCGTRSIRELNMQGFLVACQGGKKKVIADFLHDDKHAENLKKEIELRIMQKKSANPQTTG